MLENECERCENECEHLYQTFEGMLCHSCMTDLDDEETDNN